MDENKTNNPSSEDTKENNNTASPEPQHSGENKKEELSEKDNDKLWAALAYILFFIPLLKTSRSEYVTFHTNQGTLFFIFAAGGHLVLSAVPIIGWMLLPVFFILVVIFFVMGILNALGGKMKRLPWFGHLEIIK